MTAIDNDKLNALVGKMLGDLGGAFSVPTAGIGFRLGLFDALHREGPASASELAKRTGLTERSVREWALAQASNGYIAFDKKEQRFSLTPEQAMVFAVKDSPVYLEGAFDLAAAMMEGRPKVEAAFKHGKGVAWGESSGCCFARSAHSFGQATSTASCNPGFPRWKACRKSRTMASRSRTSVAASASPRC
ncbi:MAG TPA: hypothetical protein VE999_17065 [Gemmataceae bacterium]|nr:hypothetical protein [Gemmataceae bacterium]